MKILIISQWFSPEEPDLKGLPFAKELHRQGHEVQVLTGFPNYPGGKIYPGYKLKFIQKEKVNNIDIIRVPLYPSHDRNAIKRILNYISFALSATFIGIFFIKKADVQYVYHPPATVALPALVFKLLRRIPIVYDIQDMWPDTLRASGMIKYEIVFKIIDSLCKICYKFFNEIIVLSNGFKELLLKRGVEEKRINVLHNWSSDISFSLTPSINEKYSDYFKGKFNILFAGNMGRMQGLESILDAAKLLREKSGIQFIFIGGGIEVPNLKKIKTKQNLDNVIFLPRVSTEEIGPILSMADILLVHLKKDPLFKITIPSKTQAYLRIGKPILMAVEGDAADLIRRAKAGLLCEPEDAKQIAKNILKFSNMDKTEIEQFGKNGKDYYERHLSIEYGTSESIKIFNKILE